MNNALIVTYNLAYLPALNALLNALDYYGHKNLDVHIAHTADLNPALEILRKGGFSFNIITHPVEPLLNPKQGIYINLMFMRYKIAQIIARDYDAICHLDGDVLLLDNIEKYFTIAGQTDLIPCAEFPHTETNLDFFKTHDPDWAAAAFPMANFPVFYSPEKHIDMMQYIWDHFPEPDNADRERNNEMYIFNYAIWACKKIDCILPLPGNAWVGDKYMYHADIRSYIVGGKIGMYDFLLDRIHLIHNKYWKEGVAAAELERVGQASGNIERVSANIKEIQNVMEGFNTRWKTKLSDLLS
jgi:hypothetical protein